MGKYEKTKAIARPKHAKRKGLWLLLSLEAIALLALVIGLTVLLSRNPLKGAWYDGEQMAYKFGSNGKGVMVLEDDLARFHYQCRGNTLHIDFESDEYEDCSYHFRLEDDVCG